MSKAKVAINGFGRIGRCVLRVGFNNPNYEIAAVNSPADAKTLAHLLKYDSVYGIFREDVRAEGNSICFADKRIAVTNANDLSMLDWRKHEIDLVLESTGLFRKYEECEKHIKAGAKKVILSAPPKGDTPMKQIVLGVNDSVLNKNDKIVSNASCTTNCLAPVVKVLNDKFKIKKGFMTTVHAYTGDQRLIDGSHKDLRRGRSAALNIIPTSTGASKAVGKVIPEIEGKLDGIALRVPVSTGSLVDLVAEIEKPSTIEQINSAMKTAANTSMKGILQYSEEPLVSSDIIKNSHSSIFDSLSTQVMQQNFVKVLSWYDNEWGYACRISDLISKMAKI